MTIHRYISSDGVALAYEGFGEHNIGRPIVLCHGIAVNGMQFYDDADWLAAHGHRVLVPHLRGHGLSNGPAPVTRESLTIERLAADLIEMLDHAHAPRVHWVGNSLGGIVALEMLKANRFETLTTFGTSYSIKLPMLGGHRIIPLWHRVTGRERAAALAAYFTSTDPAARRLIDTMLRRMPVDVVAMLGANLSWYDLIAEGAAATIPILMLHCGRDRLVNLAMRNTLRTMRARPNFRLVELPTGGHCANLDATDAFRDALISFWDTAR